MLQKWEIWPEQAENYFQISGEQTLGLFYFKPPDLDATELDGSVKIQRLKVLLQIVVPHLNYCRIVIIIIIGINKIVMIIIGKVAAF